MCSLFTAFPAKTKMRSIAFVCVMMLGVASFASAACPTEPSTDPLSTSAYSSCPLIMSCQSTLCACTGSTNGTFSTCLAASTAGCSTLTTCFTNYVTCLLGVSSQNSTNTVCQAFGNALHSAQLATAMNVSGTNLQMACQYQVCTLTNGSATNASNTLSSCSSAIQSSVCSSAVLAGTTAAPTTMAPVTTTVAPVPSTAAGTAIAATVTLSGNWSFIGSSSRRATASAAYNATVTATQTSIAALLNINASYVVIDQLIGTATSLTINFRVLSGSGATVTALVTAVNGATASTSWLSALQTVYTTSGPGGVLTCTGVVVTATQSPATSSPTTAQPGTVPLPTSSASSVGATMLFAAAAVLAMWM